MAETPTKPSETKLTPTKSILEARSKLEVRRREAESRLATVQQALQRELGWAPTARAWVVPLAAFASGLALASTLVAGMRKRRSGKR